MDPTVQINERVDVVCVFKRQGESFSLCVPYKMRWRGREIELSELALRHPTVAGKRMVHVFHMGDGTNGYRLEFDAEALTWTLACLISGEDHA
jgi:hypothetical protein